MKISRTLPLSLAMAFLFIGNASAELVLNTSVGGNVVDSRGGAAPTYMVAAGGSITLDVFVTQRGTYQPIPGFDFGDFRLSQAALDGSGNQPNGVGTMLVDFDAQVDGGGAASGFTFRTPTFGAGIIDDTNTGANGAGFRLSGFATNNLANVNLTPVFAAEPVQNVFGNPARTQNLTGNSVRLGSVTVDVSGAAAPGNYVINFSNPGGGLAFILGSSVVSGATLQPTAGFAKLTVTAVPEPSTLAIMGLVGGAIAYRRKRLGKKQAAAAVV
jgi:PEP-CTERM motif